MTWYVGLSRSAATGQREPDDLHESKSGPGAGDTLRSQVLAGLARVPAAEHFLPLADLNPQLPSSTAIPAPTAAALRKREPGQFELASRTAREKKAEPTTEKYLEHLQERMQAHRIGQRPPGEWPWQVARQWVPS